MIQIYIDTHFPFKLNYKTPETLGNDRLALAAAATILFPNSNNLVIDAGAILESIFLAYISFLYS